MFSILHISDLHRSPYDPVDNFALIAALLNDRERYISETPAVPTPDSIVVSGDLIQGARLSAPNWQTTIREQYKVAAEFLDLLVRHFLNGDRSRIVIVPGNHDVCWNTCRNAMERMPETEYPRSIPDAIQDLDGLHRWSWDDRSLYRIANNILYADRLNAYWDFIEEFYKDITFTLPIDRRRGFHFFELDNHRILIAAFESIHGNDCFSHAGALARGVVGRCYFAMRDIPRYHRTRIGVWHHSVQGLPMQVDFMDVSRIQEMAGHGFQLGLHGHQHVSSATTYSVHLDENKGMAVVGAGSLCAGGRELPRGVNRQYNIIAIANDYQSARVHVREMVEGGHFTRKSNGNFMHGYVDITWQASVDEAGREIQATHENERRVTTAAESALKSGNPALALTLLKELNLKPGSFPRRLAIEAANKLRDLDQLRVILENAQGTEEVTLLIDTLARIGDFDRADQVLVGTTDLNPAIRDELQRHLNIWRKVRGK